MPLYVYACATCEIEIELLRSAASADLFPVECPLCHGLCQREVSLPHMHRPDQAATARLVQATAHARATPHAPDCACCGGRK
ncbi:MAG: zinc ribbon domain-containing protein [Chloroflexaceae bacterium]|nr:zinc ribbon domain-containing protein [Chloroflexaceae bacterium]